MDRLRFIGVTTVNPDATKPTCGLDRRHDLRDIRLGTNERLVQAGRRVGPDARYRSDREPGHSGVELVGAVRVEDFAAISRSDKCPSIDRPAVCSTLHNPSFDTFQERHPHLGRPR
jgi:hypothetical protein